MAAELAPGRVVVPVGIKSATVAHRRVLVAAVTAEEGLKVAAEITREPVVPEAVVAWVAAVTAVAVEAIAVAVVVDVAAVE